MHDFVELIGAAHGEAIYQRPGPGISAIIGQGMGRSAIKLRGSPGLLPLLGGLDDIWELMRGDVTMPHLRLIRDSVLEPLRIDPEIVVTIGQASDPKGQLILGHTAIFTSDAIGLIVKGLPSEVHAELSGKPLDRPTLRIAEQN